MIALYHAPPPQLCHERLHTRMEALLPDIVVRDPVRAEPSGNSFDLRAPAARQVCVVEGLSGLAKQELALKERADQLRYPWLAPKERKDALLSSRHHRIPHRLQDKALIHVLRRTTT